MREKPTFLKPYIFFDGVTIFDMISHPTFFRKHTSADLIHVKIGTIVHFDKKKLAKK